MYQQLVKKPSGNERPGYRGDDAYGGSSNSGNTAATGGGDGNRREQYSVQRTQTRRNVEVPSERGDGPATGDRGVYASRDPSGQYNLDAKKKAQELLDAKIGLGDRINFPNLFPVTKKILNKVQVRKPTFVDLMRKDFIRELSPMEEEEREGGDRQPAAPIIPLTTSPISSATDQESEEQLTPIQQALLERGIARRFMAGGGIMDTDVVGGMMDGGLDEMGRQMYGLGKLVKKATRAVKKVAKSPIGKAAIAYGLTGGLGNLASGQGFFTNFMSPTKFLANTGSIFSKQGLRNIAFGTPGKFLGPVEKGFMTKGTAGIIGSGGSFSPFRAITVASVLPFFGIGTGEESEEEAEAILRDETGLDIADIRANPEKYLARRFRAEGGPAEGKEPVAKKVMPLLDMDGMEKDYRETGGFVPIGRMEKADDVPARLSKNEFVFTADAVRNAGDGDIDKGAEVMYNMMKNLENGGDVSEESQGLEGARNMFQTSQRLEEVL